MAEAGDGPVQADHLPVGSHVRQLGVRLRIAQDGRCKSVLPTWTVTRQTSDQCRHSPCQFPGIGRAALEELEDARSRLVEENDAFRRILLRITNGLQDGLVSLSNANPNVSRSSVPTSQRVLRCVCRSQNTERITAANLFESNTIASTATTSITSHASEAQKKVMGLLERLAREVWEVERRLKTDERDRDEEAEEERIQLTEAQKEVERLGAEVCESKLILFPAQRAA